MNEQAEALEVEEAQETEETTELKPGSTGVDEINDQAEERQDEESDDDSDGEEVSDNAEPVELEYEDIDIDGVKYSLPKGLKDNVMMQADYTRKTQAVAEQRRAIEDFQKETEVQRQQFEQHRELNAELHSIDSQIKQYQQVDWATLQNQSPEMAQQHQFNFVNLQNERQQKAQELEQTVAETARSQEQFASTRKAEIVRSLHSEVEGWSGEKAQQIVRFAQESGYTREFVKALDDGIFPDTVSMVKTINEAMLYRDMTAKAKKLKGKPPLKVVPSKKVTGKRTNKADIYSKNMSTAERIKLRQKQDRQKRN